MNQKAELPAGWRQVMVIKTPNTDLEELGCMGDYVLASLEAGVLVIPEDWSWSLEAVPDSLCRVQKVSPKILIDSGAFPDPFANLGQEETDHAAGPLESERAAIPTGRNAEEKRAVQERRHFSESQRRERYDERG